MSLGAAGTEGERDAAFPLSICGEEMVQYATEKCSSYTEIKLQRRASYFWRGQKEAPRDQETPSSVFFQRCSVLSLETDLTGRM